jgi:4-hydroxy-3-methylbut-2-en-1-yl diphosphate reductase
MKVLRADALGLCFGVRDALDVAFSREDADEVTVYGELVHNETVIAQLQARGFQLAPEDGRETAVPTTKVLVTAHGIANRERERLLDAGKELIDTTCPLVQKVHNAALRLQEAGYFPVVIGKHGHVEVLGVTGDLDECAVVATVLEGEALVLDRPRIGVVSQTTFAENLAAAIVAAIGRANPGAEIRFQNTVCDPTRQRRAAVERLLPLVDAMVVVGGRNSNNTRQLVRACEDGGVRAVQVQGPVDLDPSFFAGCAAVGLTAGTSTLAAVVDDVQGALAAMNVWQPDRTDPSAATLG